MSSTTKELRDQYFDEFLQIYHSSATGIIRLCGSDPDELYTFNDLQNELKEFGIYGVLMAPFLLQIIVSEPKNIVDMDSYAENFGESTEMATLDDESEPRFKKRFTDVFHDAKRYGWIK